MSTFPGAADMDAKIFEVAGLAPPNCSAPTGMRDEIILLSWLIVLMRMQESSQIRCEWRYEGSADDSTQSLSPNEVMMGLQSHTGQVAASLAGIIPSSSRTTQSSIRLSNGSLSQKSDDAKDEVRSNRLFSIVVETNQDKRVSSISSCAKVLVDCPSSHCSAQTTYHNGQYHG